MYMFVCVCVSVCEHMFVCFECVCLCFYDALQALPSFLCGLEMPKQKEVLQSGVRQYLHRMIICLGDELLKYVPVAISLLLKDCKASHPYVCVSECVCACVGVCVCV